MACEQPRGSPNPRYKDWTPTEIREYAEEYYGTNTPPDLNVVIPCGYCLGCQKSRLNGYRLRLLFECEKYPNSIFITLTFDNSNLERFKDNPNRAIRLFLERTRKFLGKQIRHWFVAEYGSLNGRVHYHGILFNVPPTLLYDNLKKLWSYGFIYLGYCNAETCSYITKYLTKEYSPNKIAPRVISSKGIGSNYLTKERVSIHKKTLQPFIEINGIKQAMPRYWYNKIFDDLDKVLIQRQLSENPPPLIVDGITYDNDIDYQMALHQKHKNNMAKGLTARKKPPTHKRSTTLQKFQNTLQNEYTTSYTSEFSKQG